MMARKSLYKDNVPCDCGGWKAPKRFKVEGFEMRGWQCQRCGDIEYSDEIDKILVLKKLRHTPIEVRARVVGNTEVLTIPKQVCELLGLRKGQKLLIKPKDLRSFDVEVE
jgi:hypothetical protein